MESKQIRISLISLLSLIFFGYSFLFFTFFFPLRSYPWFITLKYLFCTIVSLLGLIASIFVFDNKKWALKMILGSCLVFLGFWLITDIGQFIALESLLKSPIARLSIVLNERKVIVYIFWLLLAWFLSLPKIRDEFK
ncbi:MAG: hypothetical protein C4533_01310 [Candidatus Omnitrophota bacterium]|nr:MAG: hypothetical protein C4533_01310 [Candidatus Omnitrophota bacterium]